MSNYTKTTDFEAKDSLPTGDSGKIIRGAEFETEFDAISTAIATKADTAGPTFTGTLTFETISDGTIGVTAFVDEDDMSSDSATLVPTQQSVKAYVDSQVTAQDLDFQADSGGALSIDLDSEALTLTGGTGIDTSGALNEVTFAIDSTVATLTGTQTLTNKTLTAPTISGNLTTDGNIDGRDVATDGAKLDGIEANATADQTDAEIRAAVEAATDSNVFTDADHTKLDGIEALADVTDTTNVTAAGALMDSELTDITAVKSLDQGVATTDSPTFAGLTTTADVSFGDNDKAIFGAGSDLQIYHDGSNSYLKDVGTGTLNLQGATQVLIGSATTGEVGVQFVENAGVNLRHNNVNKFATTSTGIDVTGTVTADGLDVSTDTGSASPTATELKISSSTNASDWSTTDNWGVLGFYSTDGSGGGAGNRAEIAINMETATGAFGSLDFTLANPGSTYAQSSWLKLENSASSANRKVSIYADNGLDVKGGDVAFYEDTGTTAKFFWDSSAESLGIGTSSFASALSVATNGGSWTTSSSDGVGINYNSGNANISTYLDNSTLKIGAGVTQKNGITIYGQTGGNRVTFDVAGSERMRIDSSGNVGIGTDSPSAISSNATTLRIKSLVNTKGGAVVLESADESLRSYFYPTSTGTQLGTLTNHDLLFMTNTTERMRIDSSGNVGIGMSPSGALSVRPSGTGSEDSHIGFGANLDAYITTGSDGIVVFREGNGSGGNTERMRIDSSGNLLVGKTSLGIGVTGSEIRANGQLLVTADNDNPADFNRKTSVGPIALFRQDGSTVGSIGAKGGNIFISSASGGIKLNSSSDIIVPSDSSGAGTDASMDLGQSNTRFKDLYLSGGVYLGGTGSANKLDDYEEGTVSSPENTGITIGNGSISGRYTKIGDRVAVSYLVSFGSTTAVTGAVSFSLPFALAGNPVAASAYFIESGVQYWAAIGRASGSTVSVEALNASGTYTGHSTLTSTVPFTWGENDAIYVTFVYQTA